jgi:tRNA dimethylallyltransferase
MRALEVKLATGRSIREFQLKDPLRNKIPPATGHTILKYAIDIPREQLYERINHRVDLMMEQGLLEEVRTLLPFRKLNALQTVGYTELFEHFDGKLSLSEAVEKIKINTRHYAKRQLTWFRKDPEIKWINRLEDITVEK